MGRYRAWLWALAVVSAVLGAGCSTGGEPELTGQAYEGPSPVDDDGVTSTVTMGEQGTEAGDESPPTADGPRVPRPGHVHRRSRLRAPGGDLPGGARSL